MKINYGTDKLKVRINSLACGTAFLALDSHKRDEQLYMVVDKSSGVMYDSSCHVFAVNLTSGQIRKFSNDYLIRPVTAEVEVLE